MANYSLTINSRFKPFSYAEMLAPVQAATQAHQELESAYSELETKANIWDKMASETSDPKAHSIYQKYADDLSEQAGELAKNGLSLSSRQALLNMKNRYTKEITPIEDAFNRRKDDIKAQKEMMQKDPYHMYDRLASTISLDEYMDNPNLDVLSANQSKLLLKEQVSKAAHNLKTALTSVSGLRKLGLPFQYQQLVTRGYTPEQIMQTMMHDPQAAPILGKIVEDVMASSGIRNWSSMKGDWANNQMYKEAEQFAMQGLYDVIGGTEIKYHKDDYGMQLDLMKKKHAMDNPPPTIQHTPFNPLPLRGNKEIEESQKKAEEYKNKKYFVQRKDGSYDMTHAGWEEYRKEYLAESEIAKAQAGVPYSTLKKRPSDFKLFMDELNGGKPLTDKNGKALPGWGPRRAGNLFKQYIANSKQGSYDTHRSTEFNVSVPASEGKEMFTQLLPFLKKEEDVPFIQEVDFDKKGASSRKGDVWKNVGERIKATDLKDWRVISFRPSKHGITLYVGKDGGEGETIPPVRIKLPRINKYLESRIVDAATNATDFGTIINTGYYPKLDSNGYPIKDLNGVIQFTNVPLSDKDRARYEEKVYEWNDAINVGTTNLMQLFKQKDYTIENNMNAPVSTPTYYNE